MTPQAVHAPGANGCVDAVFTFPLGTGLRWGRSHLDVAAGVKEAVPTTGVPFPPTDALPGICGRVKRASSKPAKQLTPGRRQAACGQ